MRAIRLVIVVAALAAGVGAVWVELTGNRVAAPEASAAIALLVGLSFIACGLVAWRERPANALGPAMVFIGFAWFATYLADVQRPLAFTVGTAVENLYLVGVVFVILSFPSGRLTRSVDRVLFGSALVLAIGVELVWLLFTDSRQVICDDCPRNLLKVAGSETVSNAILESQRAVAVVISLLAAGVMVARWRRASGPERRAAAPVLWSGSAIFAALSLSIANDFLDQPLGIAPSLTLGLVFAAFPVSVLAVMLQQRLARAAVAGLIVELGEEPQPLDLRQALARTLGDPTLELAYWVPATRRYVDAEGTTFQLPEADRRRAVTLVRRAGEPIAALVHDPALSDDAELIDSVCAAAGLALANERLQADLRARVAELGASRARLVEAAETERRQLERDLHDGAQQRLVSIAMTLGLADARLLSDPAAAGPVLREARQELAAALEELRELSHGIRPSILTERGLAAGLEDLVRRSPLTVTLQLAIDRRLPDHIESCAYFLVSEALANAAKHAHTREAAVSVEMAGSNLIIEVSDDGIGGATFARGSGLRGLTDRVEGLGGRLSLTSPPGRGTVLRAEMPCG